MQKQIRMMKSALESRIGEKIDKNNNVLPWLIRRAGVLLSRYKEREDGLTAHETLPTRPFATKVMEFGDSWMQDGKRNMDRAHAAKDVSNESLIGTPQGVIKMRISRKKGSNEERWNKDAIPGVP